MPFKYLTSSIKNNIKIEFDSLLNIDLSVSDSLSLKNAMNCAFLSKAVYDSFKIKISGEIDGDNDQIGKSFATHLREPSRTKYSYPIARNFISPFIQHADFSAHKRIRDSKKTNSEGLSYIDEKSTSTQLLYYQTSKQVVFALRGTQEGTDFGIDLNIDDVPCGFAPKCQVHSGFLKCFRSIQVKVDSILKANAGKDIIATGHSLGGAIATLLAAYVREKYPSNKVMLYTFGSPRVGDSDFVSYFTSQKPFPYFRFVNSNDLVTMIPLPKNDLNWALLPFSIKQPWILPMVFYDFDNKPYQHLGSLLFIGWQAPGIPSIIDASSDERFSAQSLSSKKAIKKSKSPEELRSLIQGSVADHNMETYLSIITAQLHFRIKQFLASKMQGSSSNKQFPPKTNSPFGLKPVAAPADNSRVGSLPKIAYHDNLTPEQIYAQIIDRPFDPWIEYEFKYQVGNRLI